MKTNRIARSLMRINPGEPARMRMLDQILDYTQCVHREEKIPVTKGKKYCLAAVVAVVLICVITVSVFAYASNWVMGGGDYELGVALTNGIPSVGVEIASNWEGFSKVLQGDPAQIDKLLANGTIINDSQTEDGVTVTVLGVLGDEKNAVIVLELTSDKIDAAAVAAGEGFYAPRGSVWNGLPREDYEENFDYTDFGDDFDFDALNEISKKYFCITLTDGLGGSNGIENWRCLPALDPVNKPNTVYAYIQYCSTLPVKDFIAPLSLYHLLWYERLSEEEISELNSDGSVLEDPTFAYNQDKRSGAHFGEVVSTLTMEFEVPLNYEVTGKEIVVEDDVEWINGNGLLKKVEVSPLFLSCEVELYDEIVQLYKDFRAMTDLDEINRIALSSPPLAEERYGYSAVTNACAPILHMRDGTVIESSEAALPSKNWIYSDTEGQNARKEQRLTIPYQSVISIDDIAYIEYNGKFITMDGKVTDTPPEI